MMLVVHRKWIQFRRNKLARNTLALYGAFFANIIAPLVTVPYTVRVLTPQGYGSGAFALSLAGFVGVITAYGFGLTACRQISVHRDDIETVSRVASEVVSVELLLLVVCFVAYAVSVTLIVRLHAEAADAWIAFLVVALGVFNPGWLYQGLEELQFSSRVSVVSRLIYVPALFLVVRGPGDTFAWLALQAATAGLASAWLWAHACRRLKIRWVAPNWRGMRYQLRQGFAIFFSHGAVSLYTSGNVFILGMLTNVTVAGYYSAAERLVRIAMSAWGPLQKAVFPRVNQLAAQSGQAALRLAGKMLLLQGGMGAVLSASLFVAAPWIVPLAFGARFEPSVAVLRILAILPIFIAVSNVLGVLVMVPFNKDRAFALVLLAAGLLNVGLGILLAPQWQASGMAVSAACSECLVTTGMFLYLWRNRLTPWVSARSEVVHV